MSGRVFVGVDGGGTHTLALVGRSGDAVLGRGEAGPSNPQAVGFDAAVAQLAGAVRAALASAGAGEIARATLGIAGASRVSDRARLTALLAEALEVPGERLQVCHDVTLLLPAAGLSSGVAIVAGTGSSSFGVAPDGRTATAGGYGYLLGDEGSAFDVGRAALRAVLRADDDLGPPTGLAGLLGREQGMEQPRDLIRIVYQSPSPRAVVAGIAPLVVDAARSGDAVARDILAGAGRDLAQIARAVARRLDLPPGFAVVGTGGMFQAGDLLIGPLRAELARAGAGEFARLDREPALGALRLAAGDVFLNLA
jgi:N-acetylglucosamine kinase-like BadF-type ATPase